MRGKESGAVSEARVERRGRAEILEDLLKWASSQVAPFTAYEGAKAANIDFNSFRRALKVFELIARFKILILPLEDRPDLYVVRKIEVKRPKIA